MLLLGVDFTSAPSARKPITCATGTLAGGMVRVDALAALPSHAAFRGLLHSTGRWIGGFDFPFGMSRRFLETAGLPTMWCDYARTLCGSTRAEFVARLKAYRAFRAPGDKEHRRATDRIAGSVSPQKLENPPVGLMFYEGVGALLECGATIAPGLKGDPRKIALEAYPGALARALIGRTPYKSDIKAKQTTARNDARRELLKKIRSRACQTLHGLEIEIPREIARDVLADPSGDKIDALLCLIQAGWAAGQKNFGIPERADPAEGWIIAADLYAERPG